MSRAFLIDSKNRKITPYENTGLKSLQSAVGGYIEGAYELPNGDYLFVDEEGLLKNPKHFFHLKGNYQPNAGNGLLVGPEVDTGGDSYEQKDVQTALEELQRMVTFLDHLDIVSMVREGRIT